MNILSLPAGGGITLPRTESVLVESSVGNNPDSTAAANNAALMCWNQLDGTQGGTDGTASVTKVEMNIGRSALNNTLSWVAVFPNVPAGSHIVAVVCKAFSGPGTGNYDITNQRILTVRGVG